MIENVSAILAIGSLPCVKQMEALGKPTSVPRHVAAALPSDRSFELIKKSLTTTVCPFLEFMVCPILEREKGLRSNCGVHSHPIHP